MIMISMFFKKLWFCLTRQHRKANPVPLQGIRLPAQGKLIRRPTGPLTNAVRRLNRLEKSLKYMETEADVRDRVPPEMIAWFKAIVETARGEVIRLTRLCQQKSQEQ